MMPPDGPPEGYTRFVTPTRTIQPGESGIWLEWVAPPADADLAVLDITGTQTIGGHHAILYTTSENKPIGTIRPWQNTDTLTARFVGGVGGANAQPVRPPDGTVFRIPKGAALAVQTHYFNSGDAPIEVHSTIDAKLAPLTPDEHVASLLGSTSFDISAQPGGTTKEIDCPLPNDVQLVRWANHMHEWGAHASTVLVAADGSETMIKDDPEWKGEWATNPNWDSRPLTGAMTLPAGSILKTTCTWSPDITAPIMFPDEMCAFVSFYLGDADHGCVDGQYQ